MIVVDSSVWISYFAGVDTADTVRLEQLALSETLLVGDIILLEVLRGARTERAARQIQLQLQAFEQASMLNPQLASLAARNYRWLRGNGITIRSSIDMIIATFCIERGYALLQRDRDFVWMQDIGLQLA